MRSWRCCDSTDKAPRDVLDFNGWNLTKQLSFGSLAMFISLLATVFFPQCFTWKFKTRALKDPLVSIWQFLGSWGVFLRVALIWVDANISKCSGLQFSFFKKCPVHQPHAVAFGMFYLRVLHKSQILQVFCPVSSEHFWTRGNFIIFFQYKAGFKPFILSLQMWEIQHFLVRNFHLPRSSS